MDTFEKIIFLFSQLGINIEHKCLKPSEYAKNGFMHYAKADFMYYAKILSYDIICRGDPTSFKTIDAAYLYNQLWYNKPLCFNDYECNYVLECLIASRWFKVDCEKNICIGNPFYNHFEFMDLKTEYEIKIHSDLLNISDMYDKNINDVKRMLEV